MLEQPQDDVKYLAVSRQEADYILDAFRCANQLTRKLALKAASLVLEFESDAAQREAERITEIKRALQDEQRRKDSLDAPLD